MICVSKWSLIHSTSLLDCLCSAVAFCNRYWGSWNLSWGPGLVNMRKPPVIWKPHLLLPPQVVCSKDPLILTHKLPTGLSEKAELHGVQLLFHIKGDSHPLLSQTALPKKSIFIQCSTPAVQATPHQISHQNCSPTTACRPLTPPIYSSCCMHLCRGTSESHPFLQILQKKWELPHHIVCTALFECIHLEWAAFSSPLLITRCLLSTSAYTFCLQAHHLLTWLNAVIPLHCNF